MSKRKYTKTESLENEILSLRAQGCTRCEIALSLGLDKGQIKNWVSRYNRKQRQIKQGETPKKRGRPRKDGENEQNKDYVIRQLKMENELLRNFLLLVGRK